MNRPKVTNSMILEAAKQIASELGNSDAQTIADYWMPNMDGYALARELDFKCGWDISSEDVEILDNMSHLVRQELRKAEREWADKTNPQPPLPIGTKITKGTIDGIYNYEPARYLVKENGCNDPNRHLIIKFEDAIAV